MSPTTATAPFTVVYRDDLTAVCPYCEHEITEVYARKRGFPLGEGRTVMFFCPHCRKVLGFGKERMI
jgi:hypothetical protein